VDDVEKWMGHEIPAPVAAVAPIQARKEKEEAAKKEVTAGADSK